MNNNNKLLICIIIGILILISNQAYSPSTIPQQFYNSNNCSLGYTNNNLFSCYVCKKGFGLAYDGNLKTWICLSNAQYKVDKCAQWECEPTSQCNCKCIKCACGYGLFMNDTVTQCWNNEFFVRQCEYYNSDGTCRQCKYNYDTNLFQNANTGVADTATTGTNTYTTSGWLSLDYGLLPNGNCINNRDMDANSFAIPHCNIYSIDNNNNEYYCSQCHQTYRMYSKWDNTNINYFFKYTYVAYYAPNNGTNYFKACLKVPYQYDDAFSKDKNTRLDFTKYSTQNINTGYENTIYCDETKSMQGNFDQLGKPILRSDSHCTSFTPDTGRTNISNTCYYVYLSDQTYYTNHIGCYISPGLLDTNSKRLCTLWSQYIDNFTAVCRACQTYVQSSTVILPDLSGLNCINVDSYFLLSLKQNCAILENGSTSAQPSCYSCTDSTNNQIIGTTGTQTCAKKIDNCRTYWTNASDLITSYVFLGNCLECHWGFTAQVFITGDTSTNQTSKCVWNNWQDPGKNTPFYTKGIPGCQIFNLSTNANNNNYGLCMYSNNLYQCKSGFQSGTANQADLTKVCLCAQITQYSTNLDVCPRINSTNCTNYYDQRFCQYCPATQYVMTSDDVQCSNYTQLNTTVLCSATTSRGICHFCDKGNLLKKSKIGTQNFTCYAKPTTFDAYNNNLNDDNCLYLDDTATSGNPKCEYNTLTKGMIQSTVPISSQNYDEKCTTPLMNTYGSCQICNSDSQPPSTSNFKASWFNHFPYCIPKFCDAPFMHPTICLTPTFNANAATRVTYTLDIFSNNAGGQLIDHTKQFILQDISNFAPNPTTASYCSSNTLTTSTTDASIAVDWNQAVPASITKKCIDNTATSISNCLIADFYTANKCLACKTGYKLDANNAGKCIALQQTDVDPDFPNCNLDSFNTLSVLYSVDTTAGDAYTFSFCSNCTKGFIPSVVAFSTVEAITTSTALKTSTAATTNKINECVALNTINFVTPDPACRVAYKSSSSGGQQYTCWKCELSRYLANDGSCHQMPYNCLLLDLSNTGSKLGVVKCQLCKYGYKLNTNALTLSTYCAYDTIKHCTTYTDISGSACSACDSGYWLYNSTACIDTLCAVPSNISLDYCYLCKDMVTYFVNITANTPDTSSGKCIPRNQGYEGTTVYTYNYFTQYSGGNGVYQGYQVGANCEPANYSTTIRTVPDCNACFNQIYFNLTCNRDKTIFYLLVNRTFTVSGQPNRYYSMCVPIYNTLPNKCFSIQNNSNFINADNCIQCQPGNFITNVTGNNDTNTNLSINTCIPVDANCQQSDSKSFQSNCSKCGTGMPVNDCLYPSQYSSYNAYYVNATNVSQCILIPNCIMSDGYNNSCGYCTYPTYGLLADQGLCISNTGSTTIPLNRTANLTANCRRYTLGNNSVYQCDLCHDTYFKVFDTSNPNYLVVKCFPKTNCLSIASGVTIPNITSSTQTVDPNTFLSKLSCGSCTHYSYRYSDSTNNFVLTCSNTISTPNNYFGCAFKESFTYYQGTYQNPTPTKQDTCTSCASNQCQNFVLVQDYTIADVDTYYRIFPTYCMNNDHECGIDNCRIIRSQQYAGSASSNKFYYNYERLLCGQCFYGFDLNAGSSDCDTYNTTNDGSTIGLVYPISGQDGTGQDGGYITPSEGTDGKDGKDGKEGPGPGPTFGFPSLHLNYGLELVCLFIFGVIAIIYG